MGNRDGAVFYGHWGRCFPAFLLSLLINNGCEKDHISIQMKTIHQNVKIHIDKIERGEYTIEKHIFSIRSAQHYQSFYYISGILDKVTEEERNTPLYYWASVFKAQTWKELMILAEKSESIKKAVLKLHELTGEEKIRLQCEARERYWMDWQSSMKANRKEGREEGREEERKNTEYEKKRADKAEEQVKKLRELLEKNGISLKE